MWFPKKYHCNNIIFTDMKKVELKVTKTSNILGNISNCAPDSWSRQH